ncbi:MAG: PP2C family protein-serine/threonine phosphatase [bacterium]|nr:PP2C family protein-serine/threonine phosphatase [bacterium]
MALSQPEEVDTEPLSQEEIPAHSDEAEEIASARQELASHIQAPEQPRIFKNFRSPSLACTRSAIAFNARVTEKETPTPREFKPGKLSEITTKYIDSRETNKPTAIGEYQNSTYRAAMEDTILVTTLNDILGYPKLQISAVFDGHGQPKNPSQEFSPGTLNSQRAAERLPIELHHILTTRAEISLEEALFRAVIDVNNYLCTKPESLRGGCTAAITLMVENAAGKTDCIIANVGDSRVLGVLNTETTGTEGIEGFTIDHTAKPTQASALKPKERDRIAHAGEIKGSRVYYEEVYTKSVKVRGGLNMTRSLGDKNPSADAKYASSEGPHTQLISGVPDIYRLENIEDRYTRLVITCDGIFEAASYDDIYRHTAKHEPEIGLHNLLSQCVTFPSRDNCSAKCITKTNF